MALRATFDITFWLITNSTLVTRVTFTNIGKYRNSMMTGRCTYSNIAANSFITIKTLALFRRGTKSIYTQGTASYLTDQTLPARITDANVRCNTTPMNTVWITDCLITIYTCPSLLALATLAIILVVCQK